MSRMENEIVRCLTDTVESVVESEGMELVDLQFRRERVGWVVRIFIDKTGGVNLDDCGAVSRQIGHVLDVENVIPYSYTLEVSSPGVNRPLKTLEDFIRFQGNLVQVQLSTPLQGRKKWVGTIGPVRDTTIELCPKDPVGNLEVPFHLVEKANLEFDWNAERNKRHGP